MAQVTRAVARRQIFPDMLVESQEADRVALVMQKAGERRPALRLPRLEVRYDRRLC
jgi:hypothetical protein